MDEFIECYRNTILFLSKRNDYYREENLSKKDKLLFELFEIYQKIALSCGDSVFDSFLNDVVNQGDDFSKRLFQYFQSISDDRLKTINAEQLKYKLNQLYPKFGYNISDMTTDMYQSNDNLKEEYYSRFGTSDFFPIAYKNYVRGKFIIRKDLQQLMHEKKSKMQYSDIHHWIKRGHILVLDADLLTNSRNRTSTIKLENLDSRTLIPAFSFEKLKAPMYCISEIGEISSSNVDSYQFANAIFEVVREKAKLFQSVENDNYQREF